MTRFFLLLMLSLSGCYSNPGITDRGQPEVQAMPLKCKQVTLDALNSANVCRIPFPEDGVVCYGVFGSDGFSCVKVSNPQ